MTVSIKSLCVGLTKRAIIGKRFMSHHELFLSLTPSKCHRLSHVLNILIHTVNGITEGRDEAWGHVWWKNSSLTLQMHVLGEQRLHPLACTLGNDKKNKLLQSKNSRIKGYKRNQ